MKKDDIVVINILVSTGILAVLVLLLVFGTGSNLYGSIVGNINSASGEGLSNANIYDICYYKGFGVVYGITGSIALFATAISAAALFFRKNGAVRLAYIAGAADALTAVVVLISAAAEGSVPVHRFVAGFYLKDIAKTFEITKALGIIPVVMAVIILVLSAALLIYLKMTGIGKLKVYNSGTFDVRRLLIPVIYGSVVLEVIRNILIGVVCDMAGGMKMTVHTYMADYYFVKAIDFNLPYVWFLAVLAFAVIIFSGVVLKNRAANSKAINSKAINSKAVNSKAINDKAINSEAANNGAAKSEVSESRAAKNRSAEKFIVSVVSVEILALIVRAVIYFVNPPRLFGYLTIDNAVCDATEAAYPAYIIMYVLDVLLLLVMAGLIIMRADNKKILMLCAVHAVISIIAVLAGQLAGAAGIYYACAIANIIALVCLFYMAYVRRSHH